MRRKLVGRMVSLSSLIPLVHSNQVTEKILPYRENKSGLKENRLSAFHLGIELEICLQSAMEKNVASCITLYIIDKKK